MVTFFYIMGMGDHANTAQLVSDPKARKDRLVLSCKWNYSACTALESSKKTGKEASCLSHREGLTRCLLKDFTSQFRIVFLLHLPVKA